jgi:hypothetical protein
MHSYLQQNFILVKSGCYKITHPSCIMTHPKPVPEASQYILNDLVMSGCARTGDVVSNFFNV